MCPLCNVYVSTKSSAVCRGSGSFVVQERGTLALTNIALDPSARITVCGGSLSLASMIVPEAALATAYGAASTLRLASFFARLFSDEWAASVQPDEEVFLDRDPDAFRSLLSCMRNRSVLLPEHDTDLCKRVFFHCGKIASLQFFGKMFASRGVDPLSDDAERIFMSNNYSFLCAF